MLLLVLKFIPLSTILFVHYFMFLLVEFGEGINSIIFCNNFVQFYQFLFNSILSNILRTINIFGINVEKEFILRSIVFLLSYNIMIRSFLEDKLSSFQIILIHYASLLRDFKIITSSTVELLQFFSFHFDQSVQLI